MAGKNAKNEAERFWKTTQSNPSLADMFQAPIVKHGLIETMLEKDNSKLETARKRKDIAVKAFGDEDPRVPMYNKKADVFERIVRLHKGRLEELDAQWRVFIKSMDQGAEAMKSDGSVEERKDRREYKETNDSEFENALGETAGLVVEMNRGQCMWSQEYQKLLEEAYPDSNIAREWALAAEEMNPGCLGENKNR